VAPSSGSEHDGGKLNAAFFAHVELAPVSVHFLRNLAEKIRINWVLKTVLEIIKELSRL
jgi:hypothetical protein